MTRRLFEPGSHQIEMRNHLHEHPRCAIFATMGSDHFFRMEW